MIRVSCAPLRTRSRVFELGPEKLDTGRGAVVADDARGLGKPDEADAVGPGELVLVGKCGNQGLGASVGDRDGFGTEPRGGGGDVDCRVTRADHHDVLAYNAFGQGPGVRLENEVERFPDPIQVFALDRERRGTAQADAQEDVRRTW